ncbi:hypothetical protein [Terrarubrum flagellatum]|uniref:hypothetical protein n=1 Tax=Terrirubrum flagellatum TaxID=2895980 RepID=UPI0031453637
MQDMLLQAAGAGAIIVALIHWYLSETHVFTRLVIEPPRLRPLVRLVWHCSTVAWIAGGVLLIVAPMFPSPARHWIVATMVANYLFASAANAWATKGRHFGWMALATVSALAVAGY